MSDLIGFDEIFAEMEKVIGLIAQGDTARAYTEGSLGIERAGLEQAAREAAEEPFMKLDPLMVVGGRILHSPAKGSLFDAGLSARQRELVKEELNVTFLFAFQVGRGLGS